VSGPLPKALAPLTIPLSWAYRGAIAHRNRRYDRPSNPVRFDRPVISVGNITAGGTGKTPMVESIVRRLKEQGVSPVIAMRGYGAKRGARSDEFLEYAQHLPDVPVLAQPDRAEALRRFLPDHPETKCIVLDDGFQHRRIARDLDLVLIDAQRDTMHDHLLPRGNLREPLRNLRRADAVVVTHAPGNDEALSRAIARHHGKAPIAWTQHEWMRLQIHEPDGREGFVPLHWLRGRIVLTMFGTGNPESIAESVRSAGGVIRTNLRLRDHHRHTPLTLRRAFSLTRGLDAIVTTSKDWVKIRPLLMDLRPSRPIVIPELTIRFVAGEADFLRLIREVVGAPESGGG